MSQTLSKHLLKFKNLSLALTTIVLSIVFCATSYANRGQGQSGASNTLDRVTLQLRWTPQFQFAGYYMAQIKNFYADEGLDVRIIPGNGNRTQILEEVLSRRADFGIGNSGLAIAATEGKPVTVAANIFQRSAAVLVTRPGMEKSLQALSQRNLALRNLEDNPELYGILNRLGLKPAELPRLTTGSNGYGEFMSGEVDGFNAYLGNETYLLKQSNIPHVIIDPVDYGLSLYGDTVFTHTDLAKTNPDLVARFARATIKGWIYALDHTEEAVTFLHEGPAKHKTIEHLRFEADVIKNLVMPDYIPVGNINPERWQLTLKTYKDLGLIQSHARLPGGFYISYWQTRHDQRRQWAIVLVVMGTFLIIALATLYYLRLSRKLRVTIQQKDELLVQVERTANHDQLTGLPNRRLLFDRINRAIIYAKRNKLQVGVCVIDLDGFKRVNDECGHPSGDQLLVEVADRLKLSVRESDSAGRLGGDEFFFMTDGSSSHEGAHALIQRLRGAFTKPFAVGEQSYVLSFSYGLSFYPEDGQTTPELISKADSRMYENKTRLKLVKVG